MYRYAARRQEPTEEQQLRIRRSLRVYTFFWIAEGLVCGAISAAFDKAWVDIAVATYIAVVLGALGLLILRRRDSLPREDEQAPSDRAQDLD